MILCDKLTFSEPFCLVSLRPSRNDFLIKSGHIYLLLLKKDTFI